MHYNIWLTISSISYQKKRKMTAKKYEYMQHSSILLGAKVFQDEEQILVNAKDRED